MDGTEAGDTRPEEVVRFVTVSPETAGQRIDNFLLGILRGVPRSHVYRILRRGEVRVNRGRIAQSYRLHAGDVVRIPPVRLKPPAPRPNADETLLQRLEERVLYEDENLLAVAKPPGLAVHGGSGIRLGAIEALRQLRPDCPQLELVHRLDRETSGCLLLAKRRSTLRRLHELFRGNRVQKTYLALVRGDWGPGRQRVEAALSKSHLRSGERMVEVSPAGKPALSLFEASSRSAVASLVRVRLVTGRTHQIRVHAAHVQHPLAGDTKYGDDGFNRQMRLLGLKRLFLHAWRLDLPYPGAEGRLELTAPLEGDLIMVLNTLGLSDADL